MTIMLKHATQIQNANEKDAQRETLEISRIFYNPEDQTICFLHDNNVCPMIYAAPMYPHEYRDMMDDIEKSIMEDAKALVFYKDVFMSYPAKDRASSAPYRNLMLDALREASFHRPPRTNAAGGGRG